MKKASPHKRTGRPKLPGFFDHFFYWMWRSCRHGFPDRSFVVISVVQFACLLFPVAVVLQFLDSPSVRFLYETDNRLTLFPLILPFPILLWRNMRIYTEERYRMMHDFYGAFHVSVRQRYRLRFLVCTVLAVLAILLEIWLFTLYHDRCILGLIQQWDNIIDKENRGTRKEGFVALGWYVGFALLAAVVVSAVKSAISGISLSI